MYRFIPPLDVLTPYDSKAAVYAQVFGLFCVLYMPLFGLVQARPWFRSSMWISSVSGISNVLCTSEGASATRTSLRMQHILRLGTNSSWCVPLSRSENVWFLLAITASQWRNVLFDPCECPCSSNHSRARRHNVECKLTTSSRLI